MRQFRAPRTSSRRERSACRPEPARRDPREKFDRQQRKPLAGQCPMRGFRHDISWRAGRSATSTSITAHREAYTFGGALAAGLAEAGRPQLPTNVRADVFFYRSARLSSLWVLPRRTRPSGDQLCLTGRDYRFGGALYVPERYPTMADGPGWPARQAARRAARDPRRAE